MEFRAFVAEGVGPHLTGIKLRLLEKMYMFITKKRRFNLSLTLICFVR